MPKSARCPLTLDMELDFHDYVIYRATNLVNGHFYIGVTSQGIAKRRSAHYTAARNSIDKCWRFTHAIRKHGEKAFRWEVLSVHPTLSQALAAEVTAIRNMKPQYNVTLGGEGTLGVAKEKKPVICLDDGKIYPCATSASEAYKTAKSAIREVCLRNPRRKTAGGRIFRYVDDLTRETPDDVRKIKESPRRTSKTGSPYAGIYPHLNNRGEDTGKWRARLAIGGRSETRSNLHLGIFDTAEQARDARARAIAEWRGA